MRKFTLFLAICLSFTAFTFTQSKKDKTQKPYNSAIFKAQEGNANWLKIQPHIQVTADQIVTFYKKELGLTSDDELRFVRAETDEYGYTHLRFQQFYKNVKVEGGEFIIHEKEGFVQTLNGQLISNLLKNETEVAPAFSPSDALVLGLNYVQAERYMWEDSGAEAMLKRIEKDQAATFYPTPELILIDKDFSQNPEAVRLAYSMTIYAEKPHKRELIWIDAHTGEIMQAINILCHATNHIGEAVTKYSGSQQIVTDSVGMGYRLRETLRGSGIETYDMNKSTVFGEADDFYDDDNFWDNVNAEQDEAATDVHWGTATTFDYLTSQHAHIGLDGNGEVPMVGYVHYDETLNNAGWNGSWTYYGDGGGVDFLPWTALEIVAHEIAHGVTQYSADLVYYDEYGALNESFSDIIGVAVEWWATSSMGDWTIGEDIHLTGNGHRSMENPNILFDPDTYMGNFWHTAPSDNLGVHTNSGVQNYWFYLLCEGGSGTNDLGNSYNVDNIGIQKATNIAFRNLRYYLTNTSTYVDARLGALNAAESAYGVCSPEVLETHNAWYAVGLGSQTLNKDLAMIELIAPNSLACGMTSEEYVTVAIKYDGCGSNLVTGDKIPLAFQIDGGDIVRDTFEVTGMIQPGDTVQYTFDTPTDDFVGIQDYSVTCWVEFGSDSEVINDFLTSTVSSIVEQNVDFSVSAIKNPVSGCMLTNEAVTVEVTYLGCETIQAGTEVVLFYDLNGGIPVGEIAILPTALFPGESFDYTFSQLADFSGVAQNTINSYSANTLDFLTLNDSTTNYQLTNPFVTQNQDVLSFESPAAIDSIYIITHRESAAYISETQPSTGLASLQMTGRDGVSAFLAGEIIQPNEDNVWQVNEIISAQACLCVDATDMGSVSLSFDLKQTNSSLYAAFFGLDVVSASSMRVLVDGQQISQTFNATTYTDDPFVTHEFNLDQFAGTAFELCFETRNGLSAESDFLGEGDNSFIDNIRVEGLATGVENTPLSIAQVSVYPNPVSEQLNLELFLTQPTEVDIALLDVRGKMVTHSKQTYIGSARVVFDVRALSSGIYFLKIQTAEQSEIKKVMVF